MELADSFAGSGGWHAEDIFAKWLSRRRFRQALPKVRECLSPIRNPEPEALFQVDGA